MPGMACCPMSPYNNMCWGLVKSCMKIVFKISQNWIFLTSQTAFCTGAAWGLGMQFNLCYLAWWVRGRHVILQASQYSLKKSYLIFQLLLTFHNWQSCHLSDSYRSSELISDRTDHQPSVLGAILLSPGHLLPRHRSSLSLQVKEFTFKTNNKERELVLLTSQLQDLPLWGPSWPFLRS